ncbi:alpha/beta fold hydrolase [Halalkalibacter kiskunsagensis]|uniref:Alpha/beta fold hydrolase n=1 Tax=Halalkalibacter kiskunsagensis TaxID=1548599 RepID=A0ABV6KMD5_9BACI
MSHIQKETISIGEVTVYCEYVLNGRPPIILIHGFVSSTYTFNRLMPLLTKEFSVIAIDLPGFGRSEKSKTFIYSFSNYAKFIEECIQYFKLKDVTIIGHSMGGQIALYTAQLAPYKVKNLVLLCSSGYLKSAKKPLIYCSYLPFFRFFVEQYIRKKDIKKSLENVFYNKSFITEELIEEFTRPLTEKDFYTSLQRLLRYREGDLTSYQLSKIQIPTLLIWGEEDRVVPLKIGQRLVQDLPNAKLITYEKTGHLVTEERPNDLYHHIASYIS